MNDAQVYGVYGRGVTAWRCAIRNVTDGFAVDPGAVPNRIMGCYVATRYLPYDPQQTDGTHNDGVQLSGGDGHEIVGNAFHQYNSDNTGHLPKGQCVVMTPYKTDLTNITVRDNWCYGGYTQIAAWPRWNEGGPGVTGLTITGNRHHTPCIYPALVTPTGQATARDLNGNVAGRGGLVWDVPNRTIPEGRPVTPLVAANKTGQVTTMSWISAGPDQLVETGTTVALLTRGSTGTSWVKTADWVQVDGPNVMLEPFTTADGGGVRFTAVPGVMRFRVIAGALMDDCTVTAPPPQQTRTL